MKKVPPCDTGYVEYTRKGEKLCRKRRTKRENVVMNKLNRIIKLLQNMNKVRAVAAIPAAPRAPPPPPPPSRAANVKKLSNSNKKAMNARGRMMNNLRKAIMKRKVD